MEDLPITTNRQCKGYRARMSPQMKHLYTDQDNRSWCSVQVDNIGNRNVTLINMP